MPISDRPARAAGQSDPDRNRDFRRWPAPAIGDAVAPIRSWHAPENARAEITMRPARIQAERTWALVTREVAPIGAVAPGAGCPQ